MSRRDQLVEHMSRSIRESGVGASTVEAVLKSSDVTAGSMYHYFPGGKEALAAASVETAGAAGAALLAVALESSPDVSHATEVFYTALAEEMEETDFRYGCPVGVPSTEAPGIESVRAAGASAFQAWIDVISAALVEQGVDADRAESTARFVVAAYEGASTMARTLRDTAVIYDTMASVKEYLASAEFG